MAAAPQPQQFNLTSQLECCARLTIILPSTHVTFNVHRKVKLGPTFFIPNLQIGSFGAITPFASLLRNRQDLWDVAAAGPLAGGLASVSMLLLGLSQSSLGVLPKELLVPVPTQLFQVRIDMLLVLLMLGTEMVPGAC